jgi:tight adherence protein C
MIALIFNSMTFYYILGGSLLLAGILMVIVSLRSLNGEGVTNRLKDFVVEQERTRLEKVQTSLEQDFKESFFKRFFVGGFKNFITSLGRLTPKYTIDEVNRRLSIIHNPLNLRAREFYGIRLLFLLLGVFLGSLLVLPNVDKIAGLFSSEYGGILASLIANFRQPAMISIYLGLLIIIALFLLPNLWLTISVQRVQNEIRRGLPDALDLLSVCTDAGLGFDQALQRVSDYMKTAISVELKRVVSEMEVGVSRAEALRNMSTRLDITELSAFVAVIIQSDSLGMSIAEVLHGQAEQMRIIRQYHAKEIAQKLPAKMIIPLALFIFPALIIVIMAPIIPDFLGLFGMNVNFLGLY